MVRLEQNRDGITIIKVRLKGPRLLPHGEGDVPYYALGRAFLVAQMIKNQPAMQETWV